MKAAIRGSREHVAEQVEADSPINEVEEAFEKTTLSLTRENKIVKGNFLFSLFDSCFFFHSS